jgi:ABC-type multidrug transport system fused ATPase/permease subunit
MTYVEDDTDSYPKWKAIMFVILIFVTQLLSKLIFENARFYQLSLGAKASQALGALIYSKTLKISSATNKTFKKGDIVNFIQVDAKKLIFLAESLPSVARLPLILIVSVVLLFIYFKYSFFSGLGAIVLFIIINYFLAKVTSRFQTVVMKKLDIRMNIMTECLDNIQLIKLNAWEEHFTKKINQARKEELSALFKRFMLSVANSFMIYSTYPILAITSFASAILGINEFISVPIAVASIQALNLLRLTSRWLPFFIGLVIEFLVSMERIQHFLLCEEVDLKIIENKERENNETSVEINSANFFWGFNNDDILKQKSIKYQEDSTQAELEGKDSDEFSSSPILKECLEEFVNDGKNIPVNKSLCLKNLDIQIRQGEFVAIIGEIGAGKSSLIHSIIGDMIYVDEGTKEKFKDQFFASIDDNLEREILSRRNSEIVNQFNESLQNGKQFSYENCPIKINGKLSLIEQKPWIQNMSIRDNILFGEELCPIRYNKVIQISQLGRDLDILDGGDLTEIGEKGINLSGGQKARISIARAIYSNFDIVLMDDPLSALDAHVKKKIFQKV